MNRRGHARPIGVVDQSDRFAYGPGQQVQQAVLVLHAAAQGQHQLKHPNPLRRGRLRRRRVQNILVDVDPDCEVKRRVRSTAKEPVINLFPTRAAHDVRAIPDAAPYASRVLMTTPLSST